MSAHMPNQSVLLHLSGRPEVLVGQNKALKFPRNGFLAVCFLHTLSNHSCSRAELSSFLWNEQPDAMARTNLRQLLSTIRKIQRQMGVNIVKTDREWVGLSENCKCDLDRLPIDLSTSENAFLYLRSHGYCLLRGLESKSIHVENWLQQQRVLHQAKIVDFLKSAATGWPAQELEILYRELLVLNPYDDELLFCLVAAMRHLSKTFGAIIEVKRFAARIRRELQVPPSEGVSELYRDITGEPLSAPASTPSVPASAEYQTTQMIASTNTLPRLVILPPDRDEFGLEHTRYVLAKAFVDELTTALAARRNFAVYAPKTAQQIASKPNVTVEHEFEVSFAWNRSASRSDKLIIRMLKSATGLVLFSDQIALSTPVYAELLGDLARAISLQIESRVQSDAFNRFRITGEANAYLYYLLGKGRYRPHDLRSVRATRKAFRRSLELNSEFVLPKRMLSHTMTKEWFLLARPDPALLHRALDLSEEVISQDPTYSGGYREKATALLYLSRIEEAADFMDKAAWYSPHEADLIADHADILVHACRFHEAKNQIDAAFKLNPHAPDEYYWIRGSCQFLLQDYEAALQSLSRVNDWKVTARLKSACHALIGNKAESEMWRDQYLEEYPDFKVVNWSRVIPLVREEPRKFYEDALRTAGFP